MGGDVILDAVPQFDQVWPYLCGGGEGGGMMDVRSPKGLDSSRFILAWRPLRLFILSGAQYSVMTSYLPWRKLSRGFNAPSKKRSMSMTLASGSTRVARVQIPIKATWLPGQAGAICIRDASSIYPSWLNLLFSSNSVRTMSSPRPCPLF